MASSGIIAPGSLNLAVNPLSHQPGDMIRSVNVTNDQFGAKKKRPGYDKYLGTTPNDIQDLMNWTKNDGTQIWNYAMAGGRLFYSEQTTGSWTLAAGGTLGGLAGGGTLCSGVLEDTLLINNGLTYTRHTTDGTSFGSTTLAPTNVTSFMDYQQRMYAAGTRLFFSNVGTPTDWTNDSSDIRIPGPGQLFNIMKIDDRLVTNKNSGVQHRWDGYNLVDLSTNLGITSGRCVGSVEQFRLGVNRLGIFSYSGARPNIISNPIEKQIYNDAGGGIVGTVFNSAPGVLHKYEYMLSVGTITDDLTDEKIDNAILVYDYQTNEFWNNSFYHRPQAWLSFVDQIGDQQLIFASGNQAYVYGGENTSDDGNPITMVMEGVIHMNTLLDKKWNWLRMLFNPGCEAQIQVAISDTFSKAKKKWVNIGRALDGVVTYRFPEGSRGRLLFWRISESSLNGRVQWYGMEFDADVEET